MQSRVHFYAHDINAPECDVYYLDLDVIKLHCEEIQQLICFGWCV